MSLFSDEVPDYTYLSLGGGVQSGTIAEMIVEGALTKPDLVIFADTGDEPQYVYDYIKYLWGRLDGVGVELVTVKNGNIAEDLISTDKTFVPIPCYLKTEDNSSMMRRQCTSNYKIVPVEREVKKRLVQLDMAWADSIGRVRVDGDIIAQAWLGISFDEIPRMKKAKTPWVRNHWPLIEKRMTRDDCKQWLATRGLPVPEKSACRMCPYHSDKYWLKMKTERPEDWTHVVDLDNSLRGPSSKIGPLHDAYLHRDLIPLSDVDLDISVDNEIDCDEGYCFV